MNTKHCWILAGSLLILLGSGLTGCQMFDRDQQSHPTLPVDAVNGAYSSEHGTPAPYTASETPGVTVRADFTTYHIAGQPYGRWVMEATWRSEPRKVVCPNGDLGMGEVWETYQKNACAWGVVAVTIDETTGQGTAYLPLEFLDRVFKAAHARYKPDGPNAVWHHAPGLYMNFFPADGATRQYYQFD